MPSALLLDFGGVVLRTPFELIDGFLRRQGLPEKALPWRGPFDLEGDSLFAQVLQGSLREREYWRIRNEEVEALIGGSGDHPALHQLFEVPEDELIRPEMRTLVDERMAAGHPVAILTNDLTHFHPQAWVDRIAILHDVDHLIDLSHTDYLKPDPRAFEVAAETLGLPPAEILFVDDQPVNLGGARNVGKPHVHFDPTDVAGSVAAIRVALD
ncbi:MAG TPA: HAD-IA family hydrolase [Acidimicrobiia bacterium]|nr:HAD-IA family hydrolase [Acidimicrobiia bacterium]